MSSFYTTCLITFDDKSSILCRFKMKLMSKFRFFLMFKININLYKTFKFLTYFDLNTFRLQERKKKQKKIPLFDIKKLKINFDTLKNKIKENTK